MNYFRNPKEMLFHGITSCWSYIRLEERTCSIIIGSLKGLYRGYPLAVLISTLYLNIYNSFRNLYQRYQAQDNAMLELLVSKEAIGSSIALAILHPLDTIKYTDSKIEKTSN